VKKIKTFLAEIAKVRYKLYTGPHVETRKGGDGLVAKKKAKAKKKKVAKKKAKKRSRR
jgi:hypothetical protein